MIVLGSYFPPSKKEQILLSLSRSRKLLRNWLKDNPTANALLRQQIADLTVVYKNNINWLKGNL